MGRRQNRYIRRMQKRQKSELAYNQVTNYANLYDAAKNAAKGVSWKASVQKYMINLLMNLAKLRDDLLHGRDVRKGFIEFDIIDRGKPRHISSVHFEERVAQKVLCKKILYPTFTPTLINDNTASQIGKGVHYAIQRLQKHLQQFYTHYNNSGYALMLDFKSYFASINHDKLVEIYTENFTDTQTIQLAESFVSAYGTPGLGLGAETSQINAILYLNKVDHYIKEVLACKWYGRYMDDCYILHPSYEFLQQAKVAIQNQLKEFNIKLHPTKTKIIKVSQYFTFLKVRFMLTTTGKIIKKPCRDAIVRERRKLKKQYKLVKAGILTKEAVYQSFISWCGAIKHKTARKSLYVMRQLFNKLFKDL